MPGSTNKMTSQHELRRYLVEINTIATHQLFTDCLVIGSGIAGLRAALEAAQQQNVIIVCKAGIEDSNTWQAQGGIASVLKTCDSIDSHIHDTLTTGNGICDESIVRMVIERGPALIKQLLEWGTEFDIEGSGDIATTLEGGHSHPRIAHAHGDETGKMIVEALVRKVRSHPNIKVFENFYAIDLITEDNRCLGMIGQNGRGRGIILASNTILATGGAGRLYRETTNPPVATADGVAMAYRAGAVLQDLEFVQFHPTTLYIAGASRALITEALRGEGAILLDSAGYRFMPEYDQAAELAPRDVVSRAILSQMLKTNTTHVYLDVRHFDREHFAKRFPTINELVESFDIDITHELIPVRPSAHYMIGGVKTDDKARTSINNLYACGEVAATGLHGANRLGSNSLLEGLVFGQIAGGMVIENHSDTTPLPLKLSYTIPSSDRTRLDTADVLNSLRSLMWRNVGITRREQPLREAQEIISFWQRYVMDKTLETPQGWECQNMLIVSELMAKAAFERKESRGVHFRGDFRQPNPEFRKHIELCRPI